MDRAGGERDRHEPPIDDGARLRFRSEGGLDRQSLTRARPASA